MRPSSRWSLAWVPLAAWLLPACFPSQGVAAPANAPVAVRRTLGIAATNTWRVYPQAGPVPMIKIWVEGQPIPGDCLIDTGSAITLLAKQAADVVPLRRDETVTSLKLFGIVGGAAVDATPVIARNMGNADWMWPEARIWVVSSSSFTCLLGTDLLATPQNAPPRLVIDWDAEQARPR